MPNIESAIGILGILGIPAEAIASDDPDAKQRAREAWVSRFRQFAVPPEAQREREREMARFRRQASAPVAQHAVDGLHNASAVTEAGKIRRDEYSEAGIVWAFEGGGWTPEKGGAIVWGRGGSGKTTLVCRLLRRLQEQSYSVCLVSLPVLVAELRDASFHGGAKAKLDALARVDVLALDDVGRGRGQMAKGDALYLWEAMDARWGGGRRHLIVTTNYDPGLYPGLKLEAPQDSERDDLEVALDRLHAMAPTHVCYDSPASRRGK
jgi:DNA replication protein DnaC